MLKVSLLSVFRRLITRSGVCLMRLAGLAVDSSTKGQCLVAFDTSL